MVDRLCESRVVSAHRNNGATHMEIETLELYITYWINEISFYSLDGDNAVVWC